VNERSKAILEEVRDTHKGEINTHYATCYRYHAACLAVLLLELEEES
jgi:hypothetical protein